MKIGVDLDGVCYDFTKAFCRYVGKDPDAVTDWKFYEAWGWSADRFLKKCRNAIRDGSLFREGDLIPHAYDVLTHLADQGHTIHYVTDRCALDPESAGQIIRATRVWITENDLPDASTHFTGEKDRVVRELGLEYFLDDRVENYEQTRPYTKAYLFAQPWNSHGPMDRRVRWHSFAAVVQQDVDRFRALDESLTKAVADEVRVTSETGGQKGQKLARLGSLDPLALLEVAKVAGFGERKYDRLNYMKGYDWSLSFDAGMRHRLAAWSGEDFDPESGLPHLAHAAWHDLTQLAFFLHGIGTDDRYRKEESAS